jgi:hypothetical protein
MSADLYVVILPRPQVIGVLHGPAGKPEQALFEGFEMI